LSNLRIEHNNLTTIGLDFLISEYNMSDNPFTNNEIARLIELGYNEELNND
jgi:hypothetical protein